MFFYISLKNSVTPWFQDSEILAFFFMDRFCLKFLWMLTLWRRKFFIKQSVTSKVIEGQKRYFLYLKINFFVKCFFLTFDPNQIMYEWFSKWGHFYLMERLHDLKKKCPIFYQITTLTYVLMDNFCPCLFPQKINIKRL